MDSMTGTNFRIRPSHGSPTAGTDDGKGLFETVAPRHDGVGVVLADTGKAIYEAAVRAQRAIVPELPIRNKGGC